MDSEPKEPTREQVASYDAGVSERFGYFLTQDPTLVVDRWKAFSDRVTPEFEEQDSDLVEDARLMCDVLASELRQLAGAHPYRAAEIVAEIIRRGDASFLLYSEASTSVLYIAASQPDLATELWTMLRHHVGDRDLDEVVINMKDRLEGDIRSGEAGSVGGSHFPVDRVAMALFFVEHVSPDRPV